MTLDHAGFQTEQEDRLVLSRVTERDPFGFLYTNCMKESPSGKGSAEKLSDSPENTQKKKALIFENGEEKLYADAEAFFNRFNVHNWVRFTPEEFDAIDPEAQFLDHFNAGETDTEEGKNYIAMKILRGGTRATDPGQQETPPLLSLDDGAFIVECEAVQKGVPYEDLKEDYFEYALKGITDRESLKADILKKYRKSRPHLTDEDIVNLNVTHTRFKVIGKAKELEVR